MARLPSDTRQTRTTRLELLCVCESCVSRVCFRVAGRMRSAMARVRNFFNYDAPLRPREPGAIDAIMATIVVENKRWNLTDKLPSELQPEVRAICGKDRPPPPHMLEDMTL